MPFFCPEVFCLFSGSEGVSGGVLEVVFGFGEVTGGAFVIKESYIFSIGKFDTTLFYLLIVKKCTL